MTSIARKRSRRMSISEAAAEVVIRVASHVKADTVER
jgi:hypothetical protein